MDSRQKFENEILKIPENRRGIESDSESGNLTYCVLGVEPWESYSLSKFEKLPKHLDGFKFYLADGCLDLMKLYIDSPYPKLTKRLVIGHSSFNFSWGEDFPAYDYSKLLDIVSRGYFPQLTEIVLGVHELFHNSECVYGSLGDIGKLLEKMPNLQSIELYGYFELSKKMTLPKVRNLEFDKDLYDVGSDIDYISLQTFENILTSEMPLLETLRISFQKDDLEDEGPVFEWPMVFLESNNFPKLNFFTVEGKFKKGEKRKLLESAFHKSHNWERCLNINFIEV
ncbi:hypothetical protein J0X14_10035 [Muricauda sp. CAU 1633]|uniref:hypothetical protein n=1 Tax=Allomuricauda sp. CAU 1633 TaxID=2816036 RepID=UPI001A8EDA56|nr:hypothetical protein [Muricauda sp. CAU 1633]MBO0322635.1 hypothetical protein [Muricauda sp. CAU 1633]